MSKKAAIRIRLYGNGRFLGYLKSVSMKTQKIKSTDSYYEAKRFINLNLAKVDAENIGFLTHGGLDVEIIGEDENTNIVVLSPVGSI